MAVNTEFNPTVLAIVAVVNMGDGSTMLLGSREVRDFSVSIRRAVDEVDIGRRRSRLIASRTSVELSATADDVELRYAAPYSGPLQLHQSGIYLPSVAFRALPEPE